MSEKMLVMKINGMHCEGCTSSIKEALASLDGVTKVSISLEKKKATINFDDEKVSQEKLKKTITERGFNVA